MIEHNFANLEMKLNENLSFLLSEIKERIAEKTDVENISSHLLGSLIVISVI